MSHYQKAKVYNDGSHYIAIPEEKQDWKKRKSTSKKRTNEINKKIEEIYKSESELKNKKQKVKYIIEKIDKEINDMEKSTEIVKSNIERLKRNEIVRKTRLYRKVYLQEWNYFCTFTYDSTKLNEEDFRKKLSNSLRHLASRKKWKYIGVWEKSLTNERLHFHGLFYTPNMVGELVEVRDYSTKKHQMQVAVQNTFFLKRFGRNDFKIINTREILTQSVAYMLKYIQKTGERITYSKNVPTFFKSDILENDIVCPIGIENRKLLLFDDFTCLNDGEVLGKVCKEIIEQMPKSN